MFLVFFFVIIFPLAIVTPRAAMRLADNSMSATEVRIRVSE
jgi:hypothetical protein